MSGVTRQAVSAFLGTGFTRSGSYPARIDGPPIVTSGFSVQERLDSADSVTVEYVIGERGCSMTQERRDEVTRERLAEYRKYLERRYRVTVEPDENGNWDTLLVWTKDS